MKMLSLKIQLLVCASLMIASINAQTISLNGNWTFSIDPLQKGEILGWHQPWKIKEADSTLLVPGFDEVVVPHTWSNDTRYNIIGKAWYRKAVKLPAFFKNKEVRLHFEAVFNKSRVFVNGTLAGYHEGGYTPFTINVTKFIKPEEVNYISVEVDNSWDEFSLPGSRISENSNAQLFPWYEYGGIIRDVSLVVSNKVYFVNQKIESKPNFVSGNADLNISTWIENKYNEDKTVSLKYTITNRTTGKSISNANISKEVTIKAYSKQMVAINVILNKEDVLLWDCDNPNLYDVHTTVTQIGSILDEYDAYFGIREFKVKETQLLLNGKPIRVAGANRQSDHPTYGSTDPDTIAKLDMMLMRNGNMIFSRLSHTPLSKYFYKWADENGYLIVAEITNWQLATVQMTSQRIKDAFEAQMKEMVESIWNCPSVVGYSTGNEYPSWTPEGDEWTRYQMEKFRELDTTRLLTFVAIGTAASTTNLNLAHNSFRHCDFLNFNNYSNAEGLIKNLENIHNRYPNLPIFISETGMRSDQVKTEDERIKHLEGIIDAVKSRPYVVGFAYWTFNDYLSRYTTTNKDGYRPWGMVDPDRKPKGLYKAFQTKLSPVTVTVAKNVIAITGKSDFPSYTITNHTLKIIQSGKVIVTHQLPMIEPGKTMEIKVGKLNPDAILVIENRGGVRIYNSDLK
jgi:beta-glucuronidase